MALCLRNLNLHGNLNFVIFQNHYLIFFLYLRHFKPSISFCIVIAVTTQAVNSCCSMQWRNQMPENTCRRERVQCDLENSMSQLICLSGLFEKTRQKFPSWAGLKSTGAFVYVWSWFENTRSQGCTNKAVCTVCVCTFTNSKFTILTEWLELSGRKSRRIGAHSGRR